MRRTRVSLKIRSKRLNKKLVAYASYVLPPFVLLCFGIFLYYCLFFTSSPANEALHTISNTNHSSVSTSTTSIITNNNSSLELLHSISTTNRSSLSLSPPPPVHVYEKPCDYTSGRWVRTKRGPLYDGSNCLQMKANQNCIANGRTDLGYLFWRWKPSECSLPRFDPNTFLQLITNKHIAFVGDSLSRNHLESLLCLLATVEKLHGFSNFQEGYTRWFFRSHKVIVSFYWSPFLVHGIPRKIPSLPYNKIHLDHANMKWEKDLDQIDIMVLSLGHWFLVPSVFYWRDKVIGCVNRPLSNCTTDIGIYVPIRRALRTALNSIIKKKVKRGNGIDVIVRTYSPSHFEGGWDKGGTCAKTRPYGMGQRELEGEEAKIRRIEMEEVERAKAKAKELGMDKAKDGNFKGFKLEVLDITKLAFLRPDGHPGAYMSPFPFAKGVNPNKPVQNDCVHWCLPGVVDTWNDIFLQMLKSMAQQPISE